MIVVSFDPGFAHCGFGVVSFEPARMRVLDHGDIGAPTGATDEERLDVLCTTIDGIMNRWTPDALGYENQVGVHVRKEEEGQQASYSLKRVHEVTGAIRMAGNCALAERVPIYTPAPQTIKVQFLGKGNRSASKKQVKDAVKRLFGVVTGEHAADALAGSVAIVRMHREALAKLARAHAVFTSRP